MSLEYHCLLDPGIDSKAFPVGQVDLTEAYSEGWHGTVVCAATGQTPLSAGNMMGLLLREGIVPGQPAALRLVWKVTEEDGTAQTGVARTWPVVIGEITPYAVSDPNTVAARIRISDPVTSLADRPIWGAYRACPIAEMIGGALSLAAGGEGKPTLEPVLANLPAVVIRAVVRSALEADLPYSIATGQPLGAWLGEVMGLLGLRAEMLGRHDGSVLLTLTDTRPSGEPLKMTTLTDDDDTKVTAGHLRLTGISGRPGLRARGLVLDDPMQTGFRRIGGGAVATVLCGAEIGLDEAVDRARAPLDGAYAEMLLLFALTGQPGLRPGRLILLDQTVRDIALWQPAKVRHLVQGTTYYNQCTLMNGAASWQPPRPLQHPPVIVPGLVHGGDTHVSHEPVPRDRLGRVPIAFPFIATPSGEEAWLLQEDRSGDERLTLEDFLAIDPSTLPDERLHSLLVESPDAELAAELAALVEDFRAGRLDDPFPDRDDTELEDSEMEVRADRQKKREKVRFYLAYLQAKARDDADRDRDGYVSDMDPLVSDALRDALRQEGGREALASQSASRAAGELDAQYPELGATELALLDEYEELFVRPTQPDDDQSIAKARRDAAAEPQRWPPRLPLTLLQPMAGGLHGFIPSHRHGDACRVAVHHPLWAEVIGFQYRQDRPLNTEIAAATAAIVVEHDTGHAWSGLVFRPSVEVEGDAERSGSDSGSRGHG